jgi:competence protein ComEA
LKVIAPHVAFSEAAGRAGRGADTPQYHQPPCGETSAPSPHCLPAPLNLNTASLTELDALPGVGPARAAAILQYREQHGRFASVDDLARVPGLGPAAVARLRAHLAAP